MANENNKDIANSLNKYTDYTHKGTNIVLDSVDNINKWYAEQLDKITESDINASRIETGVDNDELINNIAENTEKQILTGTKKYNAIQTTVNNLKQNNDKLNNIQTVAENTDNNKLEEIINSGEINNNKDNRVLDKNNKKLKTSKNISTTIKGIKTINNSTQKIIKTGKNINTGLNENDITSFKNTSSRIMTKPIRSATNKIVNKTSNKVKKETIKYTKIIGKKIGTKVRNKVNEKIEKKTLTNATNRIVKTMKLVTKLVADAVTYILSMLPQIAPIIIIIVIIAAIGDFLNIKNMKDADNINFDDISELMIVIEDEDLQAIYNEFLKNLGKSYLMDHSNLKYDECMEYYDCSSWVIHCLAHAGIKTISNTGAQGIYNDYCNPIDVNDRKGGDLIFLKDTYDTGEPGSISHIGIYMGTLTINGETAEWVIDTGSNPSGVRIRRYDNGWWNGPNFYGFARLK